MVRESSGEKDPRFSSAPSRTWPLNGNLATETVGAVTTTYTWDSRNRLTGISKTGLTASFVYDGLGRRKSKTVNGSTTGFWYDGNDVYAELSGMTPSFTYIRGLSIDEPYVRKGTSDEFYETDALGSSVALTNGAGASQTTYTYEPFGTTILGGTASSNAFQFTGRENDGTGLYYSRTRYYNPNLSRFISRDPIGFSGGINSYAYVENSPLSWIDPQGLDKCDSGLGSGANALADSSLFVGQQLGDAGTVRRRYDDYVRTLDPNDSEARGAAKSAARAGTPPLVRYPLEAMNPGVGARPGSLGSANVPNPGASALGEGFRIGGRVLLAGTLAADAYDVATSCKPFRSLMSASFGILGSLGGGTLGAVGGSFVAPVGGTIAGGLGGSAQGGTAGRAAGGGFYDLLFGR